MACILHDSNLHEGHPAEKQETPKSTIKHNYYWQGKRNLHFSKKKVKVGLLITWTMRLLGVEPKSQELKVWHTVNTHPFLFTQYVRGEMGKITF